ncbi:PaaI family thioesterase [Actinoplanes sp. NPDC051343]|uniref:PaaI family thioesterase n=1 Tax=Actinoplanes sp. NPDC051343 TaxID=3363906 RepID=UPI0037BA984A
MAELDESTIARLVPYTRTLGMHFPVIGPELVEARLEVSRELSTIGGGLHGGAILSLADAAAAVLATVVHDDGAMPATTESSAHFLEPVTGSATARAVPLRVGRRTVVVQIEVFDSTDVRCAVVTQTVARIPAPRA